MRKKDAMLDVENVWCRRKKGRTYQAVVERHFGGNQGNAGLPVFVSSHGLQSVRKSRDFDLTAGRRRVEEIANLFKQQSEGVVARKILCFASKEG